MELDSTVINIFQADKFLNQPHVLSSLSSVCSRMLKSTSLPLLESAGDFRDFDPPFDFFGVGSSQSEIYQLTHKHNYIEILIWKCFTEGYIPHVLEV